MRILGNESWRDQFQNIIRESDDMRITLLRMTKIRTTLE